MVRKYSFLVFFVILFFLYMGTSLWCREKCTENTAILNAFLYKVDSKFNEIPENFGEIEVGYGYTVAADFNGTQYSDVPGTKVLDKILDRFAANFYAMSAHDVGSAQTVSDRRFPIQKNLNALERPFDAQELVGLKTADLFCFTDCKFLCAYTPFFLIILTAALCGVWFWVKLIERRKLTESRLYESQEMFRSVVETAADGIVVIDREGRIVLWNSEAEKILGYSADEAIGQKIESLVPADYRETHKNIRERAFNTGSLMHSKTKHQAAGIRKDGLGIPLEITLGLWETQNNQFCTGVIRDISERKRAEAALLNGSKNLAAILNATTDSLVLLTFDGTIITLNETAARTLGGDVADLIGQSIYGFFPQELVAIGKRQLDKVITTGQAADFEVTRGSKIFSTSCFPVIDNGQVARIAIFAADVTEQRQTQRALEKAHEELEEKVRTRTKELLEANAQLNLEIHERKQAEAALKELMAELQQKNEELLAMTEQLWQTAKLATIGELAASIAHELNNPLATVSLRTENMLLKTPPDDPNHKTLTIIDQEAQRMAKLVANLLQFSRRYHRTVSSIDVTEELEKSLELVQGHLKNHQITIIRDYSSDLPVVQGDRQQLRQVFLNIFSNATGSMPEGGTLTIRTETPEELQESILIRIADTGGGISPENLTKIMEPFFTTKPAGKGTGLGLPICRRILQEHGGALEVSSDFGKGTTVSILLPILSGRNARHLKVEESN